MIKSKSNSPQLEDGYTRIANEIMEALSKTRIPGEAMQVLFVILRKTYGFNKIKDAISLSQFHLATGIKKPSIVRALKLLESMKLIYKEANGRITSYRFNKDLSSWKPLAKKITVNKKVNERLLKSKSAFTKKLHTKDNVTKDNVTKDKQKHVSFCLFWDLYPRRHGKKRLKPEAEKYFMDDIKDDDVPDVLIAVKHFANSESVEQGIGIRDAIRFLKNEYWREWLEPEEKPDQMQKITHADVTSEDLEKNPNLFKEIREAGGYVMVKKSLDERVAERDKREGVIT